MVAKWVPLVLCVIAAGAQAAGAPLLVINEVLTDSLPGQAEDSGFWDSDHGGANRFVASDWIELYNPGSAGVPLAGLTLSDNCHWFDRFVITEAAAQVLAPPNGILAPGAYAVVWAAGDYRGTFNCGTAENRVDCPVPIPEYMAGFRLSSEGEWIGLYHADGTLIDGFEIPAMPSGQTYGAYPDGDVTARTFLECSSIGRPNCPSFNVPPTVSVRSASGIVTTGAGECAVTRYSSIIDPDQDVRVRVRVEDIDAPIPLGVDRNIEYVKLFWKRAGSDVVRELSMMPPADVRDEDRGMYDAVIPGQAAGSVVMFYVEARDKGPGAPAVSTAYWSDLFNPDADPKVWFQYPVGQVGSNASALVINEILASNYNLRPGGGQDPAMVEAGGYDCGVAGCSTGRRQAEDWVEFFNLGATALDLATCDLYLTNNMLNPLRFPLAKAVGHSPKLTGSGRNMLPAGASMLVWCDGEPWQDDDVGVHADFTLSASADEIFLVAYRDANGDGIPEVFAVLDSMVWGSGEGRRSGAAFGPQAPDWSLGRYPDGGPMWGRMEPTPGEFPYAGAPNTGFSPFLEGVTYTPVMPRPADEIKVMVKAWDSAPLPANPGDPSQPGWYGVKLDYYVSSPTYVVAMRDDGQEGDLVAGDGVFTATIQSGLSGKVFYRITVKNAQGVTVTFPRNPMLWGTMFVAEQPSVPLPVISELLASNRQCSCTGDGPSGCERGGRDNRGDADDWVELYNPTDQPIALGNYYLTHRLDWLSQWSFPSGAVLQPGQRMVVWCDNEEDEATPTEHHTNFTLSVDGDAVYLVRDKANRQIVDYVQFSGQISDVSYGVAEGGYLLVPRPGEPNASLAAHAETIVEQGDVLAPQPLPAGSRITVTGRALHETRQVLLVRPLWFVYEEVVDPLGGTQCVEVVDRWDWEGAAPVAWELAGENLAVTLPSDLEDGYPYRLCVLSEYDPIVHANGVWRDGAVPWTVLRFTAGSGTSTGRFLRGDANQDGQINIADAVYVLGYLFGPAGDPGKVGLPRCLDAGDANDDGSVDIADAVRVLAYLFAGAGDLPPPFGACGVDPTPDALPACEYDEQWCP